ncbi:MAG: redoxin domain-containing protein, partial [Acidobacteria bacterium]|nr:redoxin domain-containing protein [Acidobacteriota bacterium]
LLLLWRVIDADSHGVESAVRGAGIGSLRGLFEGHRTEDGIPLSRIVNNTPSLLVFLRHAGCPFCKQALADLAAAKPELDRRGVRIILVHHSSEGSIRPVPGISAAADRLFFYRQRPLIARQPRIGARGSRIGSYLRNDSDHADTDYRRRKALPSGTAPLRPLRHEKRGERQ